MQANSIIEKAQQLGLDISGVSQNDILHHIAEQIGVDDLFSLEETLDSMLNENNSNDNELLNDNIENLEDTNNEIRNEKFGQKEYDQAKNENGVYDKNHYKSKQGELDKKLEDAKHEKSLTNKKVGVDENGHNKYKNKNVIDKVNDRRNVAKARQDAITNKLNNAKASAYNMMHPGEALKDKAKSTASNAAKNVGKKAAKGAAKAGKAVGKAAGKAVAAGAKALVTFLVSNPLVLIIVIGAIFLILLIVLLFAGSGSGSGYLGLYGYEYIEPKCTEITISGGEYAGVYDIEEYIAGVTYAEFGTFVGNSWNEAAKAGSIAARSFVLANVNDNCTVVSSQSFQVYKTPSEGAKTIANETRGLVLTSGDSIKSTQYDAFCTDSPQDDPNNYIVCQQNQKVPRSWADAQSGIASSWKNGTKSGAHGNGMSQWGAAYLAEQGYTFEEILKYYYGNLDIKSIYKSFGYNGSFPLDPNNEYYSSLSFLINKSFSDFLSERGSSITEYDAYLYDKIGEAGIGTRDGVVSAAVTLIGSLAEMGIKLNYQWGGKYYQLGTNSNWGTVADMSWLCDNYASAGYTKSVCTTNYKWTSFDCSGFVNWALRNGMQDNSITQQYTSTSGGTSLSSSTAVCKPGGVLVSEGHIVLVVGTDDENKRYIVAESTGSRIATGVGGVKLSYYSYGASGYVCKNLNELYGD